MNRSLRTHGIWLLITIGTFVTGSRMARPAMSGGEGGTPLSASNQGGLSHVRSHPPAGAPAAPRNVPNGKLPRATSRSKSDRSPRRVSGASVRTVVGGGAASPGGLEISSQLGKKQIDNLVLEGIRSSSPVERRQAFDRLLEEMRSESFTNEQAMMIRSAMAKYRASGEQWRLFDYAWGANDPAAAVAHIDEIAEQHRNGFLSNMIPGLASVDPRGAIDLFAGLEPELQGKIRNRLFEGLIDNDVEVATNYIYEVTDPENFYWRPMDELTREIVKEEGLEDTLEWAAGLPEGPLRGSAWSAVYAHWGAREPEAAVEQIIDMPPSQDRNQAINGFISALAHQDGENAVIWAGEITQPGMREAAQIRAAQQFFKQDPQGATDWFSSSGLREGAWEQMTGMPRPSTHGSPLGPSQSE